MAAAAFPAFHVTGAVHIFVDSPAATNPGYLGTCEATPQVVFQETSKPVFNDIGGGEIPVQEVEGGEQAMIACALNRFSKSTYAAILLATGQVPIRNRFSRGLLRRGRTTMCLWMVFENATDPVIRALYPNLELGWFFPQVQITTREFQRNGTADQLWVLNGQATPYRIPSTGEWMLYSSADSAFPPAVLAFQ